MRAWDFTVLVICAELAIQLIVGSGLFTANMTFYVPSQDPILDVTGYTTGNSNATQKLLDGAKQSNSDYFSLGMGLITAGNMFVSALFAALYFYPHLTATFGIPPLLAGILQVIIYLSYTVGLVQFMSGRSTTLMS